MKYIVGLGNPGEESVGSRHNIGREALFSMQKKYGFDDWKENKKTNSLESIGKIGREKVTLILPNTFMNLSGRAVLKYVTSKKKVDDTLVIYDDLDLGLGVVKLSRGKGSGGHKGVESVIKSLRSKDFSRLRLGIVAATPTGKLKKPKGDKKVVAHVLGGFKPSENTAVKKVIKNSLEAIELFVEKGYLIAANDVNTK